jgi:glycosyltransferase involved in cell wall biosynthesis
MKILFIAPLPPPITGHSLASRVFLDDLVTTHELEVIDLSRDSRHDGSVTVKRLVAVARTLMDVWTKRRKADAIYLTISESLAGNIKDLCIYLLCASRLSRMYVHVHGGSIEKLLFDRHKTLLRFNILFIKRLAGVIVTGKSHVSIFGGMIDAAKIHVVPNFAQDDLFVTHEAIIGKFADTRPLRVLYISAMTTLKGFSDLSEAFFRLPSVLREEVRIDFAGRVESEDQKSGFLDRIDGVKQIQYHGIVSGEAKRNLFSRAHVFCLPTAHFEGQPISILEAYASGCVVLTTGQDGIRDVFTDGLNGFEIQPRSASSIASALEHMLANCGRLRVMALANRQVAGTAYRTASYNASLRAVIESTI